MVPTDHLCRPGPARPGSLRVCRAGSASAGRRRWLGPLLLTLASLAPSPGAADVSGGAPVARRGAWVITADGAARVEQDLKRALGPSLGDVRIDRDRVVVQLSTDSPVTLTLPPPPRSPHCQPAPCPAALRTALVALVAARPRWGRRLAPRPRRGGRRAPAPQVRRGPQALTPTDAATQVDARAAGEDRGALDAAPPALSTQAPPTDPDVPARRALTWALLALVAALGVRRLHRDLLAALAVPGGGRRVVGRLVATAGLAVALLRLPSAGGLHDHLSFVGRWSCAAGPACDRTGMGAWGEPAFHLHGLLARLGGLFGDTLIHAERWSALLSAASVWLLAGTVSALARQAGVIAQGAGRVGLLAAWLLALHPLWQRVAVAGTFWPAAMCLLLASAWWGLRAEETDDHGDRVGAALCLALACLSSRVLLLGAPLLLLVPLWPKAPDRRWTAPDPERATSAVPRPPKRVGGLLIGAAALAYVLALVAPHLSAIAARGASSTLPAGGPLAWVEGLTTAIAGDVGFTPSLQPMTLTALGLLGLPAAWLGLRGAQRLGLLAAFAVVLALDHMAPDLAVGWPTRAIHGWPSLYLWCALAAPVLAGLATWTELRFGRAAIAGVIAAVALGWVGCGDAWLLWSVEPPLAVEARRLRAEAHALPSCDVLLVPPVTLGPAPALRGGADPVEGHLPMEDLRRLWGDRAPQVTDLSEAALRRLPAWRADGRTVCAYQSVTQQSFLRAELRRQGHASVTARPALVEARRRARWTSVRTWTVPTAQDPRAAQRVAGDRSPAVEVGWVRLEALGSTPR